MEGDIERISQAVGTEFDAILGWGFRSQFAFTIDYQDKVLHFGTEPPTPNRLADWTFRFEEVKKVPVVRGSIAGSSVSFLFDTGAPQSNIDRELSGEAVGGLIRRRIAIEGYDPEVEFRVKDLPRIKATLGCATNLSPVIRAASAPCWDACAPLDWVHVRGMPGIESRQRLRLPA